MSQFCGPQFSVIIPAYNARMTLTQTLDSLINQEESCSWEAIVVDDGSTDGTLTLCKDFAARDPRIKVVSQQNRGTGAALQEAAHHATGEFLVQLGADDLLASNYMKETKRMMQKFESYDIYSSNAERLLPDGTTCLYFDDARYQSEMSLQLRDMVWSNKIYGTAAIRRSLFEEIGGFRPEYYNEDYDLWLRLFLAGAKHIYIPQVLSYYRVQPGQKTQNTIEVRAGDVAILKNVQRSNQLNFADRLSISFAIKLLQLKIVMKKALRRS